MNFLLLYIESFDKVGENVTKQPIKLKPVYKSAIWGGSALRELYGVDEPLPELAEAWQLIVLEDGMNIMQSGA